MKQSSSANPVPVPTILTQAIWIWPEHYSCDIHNSYALFRKSFSLKTVQKHAPLYITADQSYQLYVNGSFVCRGPARGVQAHWPYDEVNVSAFLRRGRNVIAVRAHNPGFGNFQYRSEGNAGLLLAAAWGRIRLVSDLSWKCRRQSAVKIDTIPTSKQLFCQEHFDAREDDADWKEIKFSDGDWKVPVSPGVWNSMPWHSLEPRMIPLLEERKVFPKALLGIGGGKCAEGYEKTRDVVFTRAQEDMSHTPASGLARSFQVPPTGKSRFRSYLIDFGRTVVGTLGLQIRGAKSGEIIDTLHVESIDQASGSTRLAPHLLLDACSRMRFGYRLICRKGLTKHDFYHPYGFRYLILTVRNSASPLRLDLHLNWLGYPLQIKGTFDSSDKLLGKIWEICAWTQQCCSLDAYVDTPWREQAQWWGDARVQAWNTFHLSNDARLFRRGIHCIASQTAPNGLTYGHAPTIAHHSILPDFTLIWLLTIWDHYWQTGSLEAFKSHQAVIEKALSYFEQQTDARSGLLSYDKRYWLFLDWTNIFKEGYPTLYTLWLLIALEKLAILYRLSGDDGKASVLQRWSIRCRKALKRLIDADGLVRDGITHDRKIINTTCIHNQTLALMADLSPDTRQSMLKRILLPFIREEWTPEVTPSAYWITYVFSVLSEEGYGPEVIRFIRKHWAPMVEHGTTFEGFNPEPGNISRSHAWSAHPLFHFMRIIGGLTQMAPGWKKIRFKPEFIGDQAATTLPTPLGLIQSRWERKGDKIAVRLFIPKGMHANIDLPGIKAHKKSGHYHWVTECGASGGTYLSPPSFFQ